MLEPKPFVVPSQDASLDGVALQRDNLLLEQSEDTGIVAVNTGILVKHYLGKKKIKEADTREIKEFVVGAEFSFGIRTKGEKWVITNNHWKNQKGDMRKLTR